MISDIKRTSHHAVIITNYAIWHQSLKSIHYRILLIFQTKKNSRFEGQNMGGIKDMLSPPCQNMGGIHTPHPPRDLRPCWPDGRLAGLGPPGSPTPALAST